jgi:hypothetical protein
MVVRASFIRPREKARNRCHAFRVTAKPAGTYVTVGGDTSRLLQLAMPGILIGRLSGKRLTLVALKPNKELAYLNDLFTAGSFVPVIDSVFLESPPASASPTSDGTSRRRPFSQPFDCRTACENEDDDSPDSALRHQRLQRLAPN